PDFFNRDDLAGVNITIPYKREAMNFCDSISETATAIGCVNTIVRGQDGLLRGYNTDLYGFEYLARRAGIEFSGRKVLILGKGGTSLTAATAAKDLGATEVVSASRSGALTYDDLSGHLDAEVIVNTTPVGMYPNNLESLISLEQFPLCRGVIDVIYNPHRTALILEAQRLGIRCSDGLPMLVAQAKAAEELFFDTSMTDERIEEIIGILRCRTENIVLIGMPGSGKTSIGAALAALSDRDLIDTDARIVEAAGCSIPEIFMNQGESSFRMLENEVIRAAGQESGKVIAVGGGAVLNPDNLDPLLQNGRIYHINRDVEHLATEGRPLSLDLDALRNMQKMRLPLYERFCCCMIENNTSIEDAAIRIWEEFRESTRDQRPEHQPSGAA
ncbi:MAG: shikimate kinase, partial [Actinobacteria bacterium]|nr:shikimate kinase [Actinomycetota bacterium]